MNIEGVLHPNLFQGKTIAVTGGGSGINLGIAKVFARLGANVAICGRTQEKLDKAAEELEALGADVVAKSADVRAPEELRAFFDTTQEKLGAVDIVVAGAAGNFIAPAAALSENAFKTVVDIDLLGSFNTAKAAFNQLTETKGLLVMISAAQAFQPFAFQVHAGCAKAGVDHLARQLALEWGPMGIRVNVVAPGPIANTEGLSRLASPDMHEAMLETIPMGRLGETDDIGAAVAYLASPLADYVTGSSLMVDGGQFLNGSGLFNVATRKEISRQFGAKASA